MKEANCKTDFLAPIPSTATPPQSTEAFLPLLQGTATNRLRATATKNIVIDRNGNATIEEVGFKAFFKDYAKLKGGLSTGAKKLLDLATLNLTSMNHYRARDGQRIETAVAISLEEYGLARGYDLAPRQTSTPEEEEAEKKRISNVMHEIRKRANAELALLYSLSLTWTEPNGKKSRDYTDVRILQSKGIKSGYINLRFSEDIAAYLTHAYITQYPMALQAVDERNPRAYNIGYKLVYHHGVDNNRARGTANIISVTSLLEACGDMPTFEELQASKDRGHWEQRIKDPLEKALDNIVETGVILNWEYSNSKGAPLTETQITIADYQTFIGLYVRFSMNEPDQTERLQHKAERQEAAKDKQTRRKAASKKKPAPGGGE